MTEVAPAWIASTLIRHHERHGADLDQVISGPFTAQVVKFTALRTEADPHASVEAVLAECAHRVDCVFDAKATDSFERSVAGEPEERLSSNLYAFLRIEEFRIRLRPAEGLPRVVLELLKWDILSTSRRVPPRHRIARDVSDDDRIRLVLKAWWTGLSLSSSVPQSSLLRSAPTTQHIASSNTERFDLLFAEGPAVPIMEATEESKPPPADQQPKPRDDIMSRWPQMYKRLYGKGSKGLPGWLFDEPSAEQQQQLESIKVFGLDLERDPIHSQSQSQSQKKGSQSGSGSEEQQQSLTPPLDEDAGPIEVEIPPVSSSQPPLPPPTPPMSSSPAPASAPPSVPSVPARHRTPLHPSYSDDEDVPVRPRRRRPDPTSTGSETPAPSREHQEAQGETSDSELSEYERHRRRIAKGKMRAIEPEPSSNSQQSNSQPTNPPPPAGESQSLSQSQDSRDFALSRYDLSLSLPESSTPTRVATRSLPPPSRSPGKRPRYSEDAADSMGPPAAQRLRTEPVSSVAWGEGGPPSGQTVIFTPVKTEVYTPRTQTEAARQTPRTEPRQTPRTQRTELRQTPVKAEAETPVKREIREEAPKTEPETPEVKSRWEGEGKLGGWRPNLSVRGLNAEYVARVTRVAQDMRDRRRVKRESDAR